MKSWKVHALKKKKYVDSVLPVPRGTHGINTCAVNGCCRKSEGQVLWWTLYVYYLQDLRSKGSCYCRRSIDTKTQTGKITCPRDRTITPISSSKAFLPRDAVQQSGLEFISYWVPEIDQGQRAEGTRLELHLSVHSGTPIIKKEAEATFELEREEEPRVLASLGWDRTDREEERALLRFLYGRTRKAERLLLSIWVSFFLS